MKGGCRGRYVVALVVGVICAALGAAMFPVVDHVIREEVKKKVIIANRSESESYPIWEDNPIPLYMQFYLFNVENSMEVLKGEKPYLIQMGPYTYRERRVKYDIEWGENGTVTYRQERTFHFIPEMSVGPDSDMVHTLNPLLASLAQVVKTMPSAVRFIISSVLSLSGAEGAFVHRTVHEVLWGYEDSSLVTLHSLLPALFTDTTIGFFIRRNATDDGLYQVETGESDVDDLCTIRKYNGKTYVDVWTTPWANMVNGTDGSCGPPFVFNTERIYVFQSDICRSLGANYEREVESPQGISLRRFTANRYDLSNTSVNPDNIGFCTPQTSCLPSGLLNLTLCEPPLNGVSIPAVASLPHFLYADPEVQRSVKGLSPNVPEHETTIDIEPWTGFTMQISKRVQINFFIEKVPELSQLQNISRLYFPIFWLNESVVVDDEHADMVKDDLFLPMHIATGVKYGLMVIGGLLVIVALTLFYFNRKVATKKAASLGSKNLVVTYGSADGTGGDIDKAVFVHP